MKINRIALMITLISILTTFGCSPETYTGNWNYKVKDLPQGTIAGILIISETETTGFNCHVISDDGMADFDMEECIIAEGVFSGYYYDQGTRIDVTGTFADDKLSGFVNVGGEKFPLELVKSEE